jgi:hypothetical protein
MKIVLFRYDAGVDTILSIGYDECPAPDRTPPRRIDDKKFKKNSLPAMPRRGHESEVLRIEYDFHGSGVN